MARAADEASPRPLRIDISCPDAATVVVTPTGRADVCAVAGLQQAMWDALGADRPHVVVNLDGLTFLDASTLGVLVEARRSTFAAGKTLRVTCCTRHGRRLLRMTGLGGMLEPNA